MAEETISAVITALGEGAVGIVRISGEHALAVGESMFKAASGICSCNKITKRNNCTKILKKL